MAKAVLGALLVLLIFFAVVKLTDWLLVGVADLGQVQPSIAPADIAAQPHLPVLESARKVKARCGQGPIMARG